MSGPRFASFCAAVALTLGGAVLEAHADLEALSPPERVDGVAAFVGGRAPGEGVLAILRSDVELRARLSLLAAGAVDPNHAPLPQELLQATLSELLGEALIVIEAARLGIALPSAAEVEQQRQRLLQRAAGSQLSALISIWGLSDAEIQEIARRKAVVGAFLAANLEGTLEVSESDLARAFQSEPHPFVAEPFAEARAEFAAWYAQKRLQDAVARWVLSLRDRTPHRVIWTF